MHFTFSKLRTLFIAICGTTVVSGCMLAPGMDFNASTPLDPDDPTSVPTVITITPTLVAKEQFEAKKRAENTQGYKALLAPPAPYVIGAADVLSIIVWDHPELMMPNITYTIGSTSGNLPSSAGLSTQSLPGYVVSQDGYVQFPYIGTLKVAGMTEIQAKNLLTSSLDKYIKSPQVTLRVIGYRSQKVYVDGEVKAAGLQSITDMPMTLPQAITQAGGIPSTGDSTRISLTRGRTSYTIDLPQLMADGINPNQIGLRDNDVIRVPPLVDNRVYVMGEVGRQAAIPVRTNGKISLSEALGDAGGVNPASADPSEIYVIRPTTLGEIPLVYHLDSKSPTAMGLAQNFPLKSGDLVYVDAVGVVRWNRVISQLVGATTAAYYSQRTAQNN